MSKEARRELLVLTPYNRDRTELNSWIRNGLIEKGEIKGEGIVQEVLVKKDLTGPQRKSADFYQPGDVIRMGRDSRSLGVERGTYLRVVSVDRNASRVTLATANGETKNWMPARLHKVEAYTAESRNVAEGDLIRFTRNEPHLPTGAVAEVLKISGNSATLRVFGNRTAESMQIDLSSHKHWEYAYVSTIHASQGLTSNHTMLHIPDVAPRNGMEQPVFGAKSFLVGVTRSRTEVSIYTENKAHAARALGADQNKTSAILDFARQEPAFPPRGRGIER